MAESPLRIQGFSNTARMEKEFVLAGTLGLSPKGL
jgi:hypothetical protein